MFYKQLWSSISIDIINDKDQQHATEEVPHHNRFIRYSPLMVRRFDSDNCSKLHTCETLRIIE